MPDARERIDGVRITAMVHHSLADRITAAANGWDPGGGWIETARVVRQRIGLRRPHWLVRELRLDDAPMDVIRLTVAPGDAARAAETLIEAGELRTPGRGQLLLQDITVWTGTGEPPWPANAGDPSASVGTNNLMGGMALLTCIASEAGSGEQLARIALKLGAGLPVVSRGIGTGIRDRLGLMRITIPPEKEIVCLALPAHDADGIERLLIEDARLDRPGGGFLYQTGVRACLLDPLLRIGRQGHAATMEQVIAALDDLKGGTAWRKHVAGFGDSTAEWARRFRQGYHELTCCCGEGRSGELVREAMAAGAGGATISPGRLLKPGEREGQAIESIMLCVPDGILDAVVEALRSAALRQNEPAFRCEALTARGVFAYTPR